MHRIIHEGGCQSVQRISLAIKYSFRSGPAKPRIDPWSHLRFSSSRDTELATPDEGSSSIECFWCIKIETTKKILNNYPCETTQVPSPFADRTFACIKMSEGVRKRNPANAQERTVRPSETSRSSTNDEIELQPITTLDIIRLLFGLLLLNFLLSYFITGDSFIWGYQLWWLRPRVIMNMFVRIGTLNESFVHA